MSLPASDTFTRADAATLGGNWDGVTSNQLGIVSNRAAWPASGAVDKYALWSADSFADDHYSECKAYNTAGAYGYGPCVRMRFITTHTKCQTYWAFIDSSSTVTIYYMNDGSFNACGAQFTGLTIADGDVWRLSVTGTTLTLSQNGTPLGTRTDSNLATGGAAGLGIYADRGTLDDWAGGNAGTGSIGAAAGVATLTGVGAALGIGVGAAAGVSVATGIAPSGAATLGLAGTVGKHEGGTMLPYQRDVSNSTNVVLSGTYSGGTPSGIQVSWKGGAFVSLTGMTIAGGSWTGTFGAQAGDEGTLTLRWTNNTGVTATTWFALGDGLLLLGDSIAVGKNIDNLASSATPKHTHWWHVASASWVEWDSTNDGPASGCWPLLGNEITAHESVPVFLLNPQSGSGTAFNAWVHGVTGTFDNAMAMVTASGFARMRAVLVHLGVNNVRGSGNTAAATKTAVQQTCTDLNTYLPGGAVPIFWAQIGPVDLSSGTLRTEADAVRLGIQQAIAAGSCSLGPSIEDLTFSDQLHPDVGNAPDVAGRWWLAIGDTLYGTANGHGPRLSYVTWPTSTTFVATFDQDLGNSVSSSTLGFRVLNGDLSVATITTQIVTGVRQVTITVSPAATGVPTVSFASNNDAIGAAAPKGVVETLPSGATVQRVVELFSSITPGSVGAAFGVATVTGVGASLSRGVGSAAGVGTALGIALTAYRPFWVSTLNRDVGQPA